MGKQRNRPKLFDEALPAIDKLATAICYRTVTRGYGIGDVAEFLFPKDVVRVLRAAHPYARNVHTTYHERAVIAGMEFQHIAFSVEAALMLCPTNDQGRGLNIHADGFGDHPVGKDLEVVWNVHRECNVIRSVVMWLNENCSASAARYYFPSLGALLPKGHGFHSACGLRSAGCRGNIADIANDIRAAAGYIATGLLCDPDNVIAPLGAAKFSVTPSPDYSPSSSTSWWFNLL